MEDVAPELLKKIRTEFNGAVNQSATLKSVEEKILRGTATYAEANQYAIEVGKILANAYKNNLSSDVLPEGKLYYNIADRIISPTMKNNYDLISKVSMQIQKTLNEAAGIGINAIQPELNADRIEGIINRVSNAENYDDVSWILQEPVVNFSQSIVDECIKANSEFHAKAGMEAKIVRKLAGGCCEWCSRLAGTYIYPDVPEDVYRRHQRCRCTVDYIPDKSKKAQNVWSKEWKSIGERDRILLSKDIERKETIQRILDLNSNAIISIPPKKINTDQLGVDINHIRNERNRAISIKEAKSFVDDALFSVNVWDGAFERYYGSKGASYVDLENQTIRTAFKREQYTSNLERSLEVLENEKN